MARIIRCNVVPVGPRRGALSNQFFALLATVEWDDGDALLPWEWPWRGVPLLAYAISESEGAAPRPIDVTPHDAIRPPASKVDDPTLRARAREWLPRPEDKPAARTDLVHALAGLWSAPGDIPQRLRLVTYFTLSAGGERSFDPARDRGFVVVPNLAETMSALGPPSNGRDPFDATWESGFQEAGRETKVRLNETRVRKIAGELRKPLRFDPIDEGVKDEGLGPRLDTLWLKIAVASRFESNLLAACIDREVPRVESERVLESQEVEVIAGRAATLYHRLAQAFERPDQQQKKIRDVWREIAGDNDEARLAWRAHLDLWEAQLVADRKQEATWRERKPSGVTLQLADLNDNKVWAHLRGVVVLARRARSPDAPGNWEALCAASARMPAEKPEDVIEFASPIIVPVSVSEIANVTLPFVEYDHRSLVVEDPVAKFLLGRFPWSDSSGIGVARYTPPPRPVQAGLRLIPLRYGTRVQFAAFAIDQGSGTADAITGVAAGSQGALPWTIALDQIHKLTVPEEFVVAVELQRRVPVGAPELTGGNLAIPSDVESILHEISAERLGEGAVVVARDLLEDSKASRTFELRYPTTSRAVWERSVQSAKQWKEGMAAYLGAMAVRGGDHREGAGVTEVVFDDPAVSALLVEVQRYVWSDAHSTHGSWQRVGEVVRVESEFSAGALRRAPLVLQCESLGLSDATRDPVVRPNGRKIQVNLREVRDDVGVYRVIVHPVVDARPTGDDVPWLMDGLRGVALPQLVASGVLREGEGVGAAVAAVFELPTMSMPDAAALWAGFGVTSQGREVSMSFDMDAYGRKSARSLRVVGQWRVCWQRWRWMGRPLPAWEFASPNSWPADGVVPDEPSKAEAHAVWMAAAFAGIPWTDVREIEATDRPKERASVIATRRLAEERAAVIERYGLRVRSRYHGLTRVTSKVQNARATASWRLGFFRGAWPAEVSAVPLVLVMPLTQRLAGERHAGQLASWMAVVAEAAYSKVGFVEEVEFGVVIERTGRDPTLYGDKDAPPLPATVGVRVEGPNGYSFDDRDSSDPRFHASVYVLTLLAPVGTAAATLQPWDFTAIRARRKVDGVGSDWSAAVDLQLLPAAGELTGELTATGLTLRDRGALDARGGSFLYALLIARRVYDVRGREAAPSFEGALFFDPKAPSIELPPSVGGDMDVSLAVAELQVSSSVREDSSPGKFLSAREFFQQLLPDPGEPEARVRLVRVCPVCVVRKEP